MTKETTATAMTLVQQTSESVEESETEINRKEFKEMRIFIIGGGAVGLASLIMIIVAIVW